VNDWNGLWSQPLFRSKASQALDEIIELPVPEETTEIPIDIIQNNWDLSTDSDSDNDLQVSSSDLYEEI